MYIVRTNGFNYKAYANEQELYSSIQPGECPTDTSALDISFTADQLQAGRKLLEDSIQIDSCKTDLEKLLSINHFLYEKICFERPSGKSQKTYPNPVSYFLAVQKEKDLLFHCGHAAYLQAFFCSAVNIKIRGIQHIQRPQAHSTLGSHTYNEVWLRELGQWVISDFFQNRYLIYSQEKYWTAIDLFEHARKGDSIEVKIIGSKSGKISTYTKKLSDPYFTNDYYLLFYKETNPAIVYCWKNKIRHYLLGYSHFKTYDPIAPNSNNLYWMRSAVFAFAMIWFSIFIIQLIKTRL
ncbi:MAG: transglutaminase domain-containing protein [Ferruginibacter sp.]